MKCISIEYVSLIGNWTKGQILRDSGFNSRVYRGVTGWNSSNSEATASMKKGLTNSFFSTLAHHLAPTQWDNDSFMSWRNADDQAQHLSYHYFHPKVSSAGSELVQLVTRLTTCCSRVTSLYKLVIEKGIGMTLFIKRKFIRRRGPSITAIFGPSR